MNAPATTAATLARLGLQEPASIQEAEALRLTINTDIRSIEAQLANLNHTNEHGQRLTGIEYHQWRGRAVGAINIKRSQMGALKAWIREQHAADEAIRRSTKRVGPLDATGRELLAEAQDLLADLQRRGWVPDDAELALLRAIGAYLRGAEPVSIAAKLAG